MKAAIAVSVLASGGLLLGCTADSDPVAPGLGLAAAAAPHSYGYIVKPGTPLGINLPSQSGGGGFLGPLYDPVSGREVGWFSTDIVPEAGITIFDVLGQLVATGSATASAVNGTFDTGTGVVYDLHAADLAIAGPAATPGYEALVVATGAGSIRSGSGRFNRDGGSTDLYLEIEVDADGVLPALAVAASFVFLVD